MVGRRARPVDRRRAPDGIQINYSADGSTTGRNNFISGQSDFAASDIPFQTNPGDGSPPEHPQVGSYAYMPITAGGTVFMYNLKINGQRVTDLRLSGANITKIFTGVITNWDDPALAADNPGLRLPDQAIVPVVRSDGSGTSFELTEWMISQNPGLWNAYCSRVGRSGACGATSFYPTVTGMIAQNSDLGVVSYVSQAFATGSIGYVNYYYAKSTGFPVVKMLNSAGYYTEPTPQNVAVSLLQDQVDTTDVNNPALYLTQKLEGVYTDPDPRTYPLSSYGYLILPTKVGSSFSTAKGLTLAAFATYAMCQGQTESANLGYSPMPINLVEASFAQIAKIPGADVSDHQHPEVRQSDLLPVRGEPAGADRRPTRRPATSRARPSAPPAPGERRPSRRRSAGRREQRPPPRRRPRRRGRPRRRTRPGRLRRERPDRARVGPRRPVIRPRARAPRHRRPPDRAIRHCRRRRRRRRWPPPRGGRPPRRCWP